ncbi:MAG: tetratricopeptide repeat protein [Gammaproteobacteria bacterium]|nr:MAG: tetratricopeptide repeat protein [Gammaproteobacteria bacterium]
MKKIFLPAFGILALFLLAVPVIAQKQVAMTENSMVWSSKSKQAKKLTATGIFHIMNSENEQAYQDFQAAVESDAGFSVALAFLANLSRGEIKKSFAQRAQASAASKTEGEKLLASLTGEKSTQESARETWAKLHNLYSNDPVIGHFYVVTRATPEEQFTAAKAYNEKYPEEPAMYNMLGYYYMLDKKDNAKAKESFEKYIQLYPEGANPYDSMGEFYLTTGDMANAEKYYKMALEIYPFTVSSIQALEKITAEKKKTEKKEN